MALKFAFSLPHAADSGSVFAIGKIPLEFIHTGTTLHGSPDIGTENATKYSTPWMPLPSLTENTKALLARGRIASENLKSTINRLKDTYISRVDPTAKDAMEHIDGVLKNDVENFLSAVDQEKINEALRSIDTGIDILSDRISHEAMRLDGTIVELNLNLERERGGLDGAEAIEHARDSRIDLLNAQAELTRKREKLKLHIEVMSEVTSLKTVGRDLRLMLDTINVIEKKLAKYTPFAVTATIVEKRIVNTIRKFFADVFSSAKPSVAAELKSALDPKERHELEEKQRALEEARQDNVDMLRRNAVLAALMVHGTEIDLRLLRPDVDEIQRHTAEVKLRTAVFQAVEACKKAVRKSAQPVECAPYL